MDEAGISSQTGDFMKSGVFFPTMRGFLVEPGILNKAGIFLIEAGISSQTGDFMKSGDFSHRSGDL